MLLLPAVALNAQLSGEQFQLLLLYLAATAASCELNRSFTASTLSRQSSHRSASMPFLPYDIHDTFPMTIPHGIPFFGAA